MQILSWAWRALVFFALFAFALNNRHEATLHWFFGWEWRAPMVFVVLGAFTLGCAFGVLAMVPQRWRRRSAPRDVVARPAEPSAPPPPVMPPLTESALEHPPRDGL
jgi:putative membrane protein